MHPVQVTTSFGLGMQIDTPTLFGNNVMLKTEENLLIEEQVAGDNSMS